MAEGPAIRLDPPGNFNFIEPDSWPKWKVRFTQFRLASGLSTATATRQVSTLLYCLGEEGVSVLSSTDITAGERESYETVMNKLDTYFKVRKNVIYERARFNLRNQQDGESAEHYIMEVHRLVENCDYGTLKDELIRDRLVVGIQNIKILTARPRPHS